MALRGHPAWGLSFAAVVLGVGAAPAQAVASGAAGAWSYVSAPGLHPPRLRVLERRPGLARGDFLLASESEGTPRVGQQGPQIVDGAGRPVWFDHMRGVLDFEQETYEGRPVLVLTEGSVRRDGAVRGGRVVVLSESYHTIATLRARAPWQTNLHEAWISGGHIWLAVSRPIHNRDLTAYGGSRHDIVIDCGLQEFRLSTGRLIRTWDALNPGGRPHVPLSASETRPPNFPLPQVEVWDPYHLNAVQALPDGELLVSMRNTWAVYLIDPLTGRTIWTLGGRRSTFTFAAGARFAWQHDARLVDPSDRGTGPNVEVSLFNDNNGGLTGRPSSGLVLELNTLRRRATLVRAYLHDPSLSAYVLGSMQLLPNGNALVGWGSEPYFSEYSEAGQQLLDVRWPGPDHSYRALFTDTWVGTPYYPPAGAVRGRTVYASWNGATRVAAWQVLAGPTAGNLRLVATRARTGFETRIEVARSYPRYQVRALDARGRILRASKTFSPRS